MKRVYSPSEVKIGDLLALTMYTPTTDDLVRIVRVHKTTKAQITVEFHSGVDLVHMHYRSHHGYMERWGCSRGECRYTLCSFDNVVERDAALDQLEKKEAERAAAAEKYAHEKETARIRKVKAHREQVDAFWIYRGRQLWGEAPELQTACGTVKVITAASARGEARTWFAKLTERKAWDGKTEHVLSVGSISPNSDGSFNSTAHGSMIVMDEAEAIYEIIH